MLALLLALLATAVTLPSIDEPLRTGHVAAADAGVVIGLEDYAFVVDVPYARRDARAIHDFLVHTRGVPRHRVQLLTTAGREQILEAVDRAVRQVEDGGLLWVYFAGHGAASAFGGRRLLLGDDVRPDATSLDERGVALEEIRALAARRPGARLVLLVDASYGGVGRTGTELVPGTRFAVSAERASPSQALAEWTAAAPDQAPGPLHMVQHGAFTYFALGALRGWADGHLDGTRDGVVTAEEAHRYVEKALRSVHIHDQTPILLADAPEAWVLSVGGVEAAPRLEAGLLGLVPRSRWSTAE